MATIGEALPPGEPEAEAERAPPSKVGEHASVSPDAKYLRGGAADGQKSQQTVVVTKFSTTKGQKYAMVSPLHGGLHFRVSVDKLISLGVVTPPITDTKKKKSPAMSEEVKAGYALMIQEFDCAESDLFKTPEEVFQFLSLQLGEDVRQWSDPTPCDPTFLAPNALIIDWIYENTKVFLNPQFTKTDPFLEKAIAEMERGHVSEVLLLFDAEKFFGRVGSAFMLKISEWQRRVKWSILSATDSISGCAHKWMKWRGAVSGKAGPRFGVVLILLSKGEGEVFCPALPEAAAYISGLRIKKTPDSSARSIDNLSKQMSGASLGDSSMSAAAAGRSLASEFEQVVAHPKEEEADEGEEERCVSCHVLYGREDIIFTNIPGHEVGTFADYICHACVFAIADGDIMTPAKISA